MNSLPPQLRTRPVRHQHAPSPEFTGSLGEDEQRECIEQAENFKEQVRAFSCMHDR
jgi:hypothetical protein